MGAFISQRGWNLRTQKGKESNRIKRKEQTPADTSSIGEKARDSNSILRVEKRQARTAEIEGAN